MQRLQMKNWMFYSLNGILAILFGLVALLFPSVTLIALAVYFAIAVLLGGILMIIGAARTRERNKRWRLFIFEGIVGVLVGLIILLNPELSAAVIVAILGIWAILMGLIFTVSWYRRRKIESNFSYLLLAGILSLLVGILIVLNPFEGSRVITVLIGIYAIAFGLFSVIAKNS